jgi:hypothetical protein
MRHKAVALALALIASLALAAPAFAQGAGTPTLELARLQKGVKTRRVSSYDKTGATTTARGIAPGQRRTLFDVKGAGRHRPHLDHDRARRRPRSAGTT